MTLRHAFSPPECWAGCQDPECPYPHRESAACVHCGKEPEDREATCPARLQERMMGPRDDADMAGRDPMFRDHNCWLCQDGNLPCAKGNPRGCEYPRARND